MYYVSIVIEGDLELPHIDDEGAQVRGAEIADALEQLAADIGLRLPVAIVDVEPQN
jgi:hypothetical protein